MIILVLCCLNVSSLLSECLDIHSFSFFTWMVQSYRPSIQKMRYPMILVLLIRAPFPCWSMLNQMAGACHVKLSNCTPCSTFTSSTTVLWCLHCCVESLAYGDISHDLLRVVVMPLKVWIFLGLSIFWCSAHSCSQRLGLLALKWTSLSTTSEYAILIYGSAFFPIFICMVFVLRSLVHGCQLYSWVALQTD
jgi:hypothetical protein